MKAVIVREFTRFDQAEYGELADPVPGAGEVVIDVEAIDTNFPDILYIEGKYQKLPPVPFSPGLAAAGRVAQVGAGVADLAPGQKVLALPEFGAFAERLRAPAAFCYPIPDEMPATVAAAFGLVYQTAYFALAHRGGLRAGETVLVLGASGGVGMAAVQLARALGAGRVIAATRGAEGAAFARDLGAEATVDAAAEDLGGELKRGVNAATGGRGVDVVIDPVGGALSAASLRAMAWQGRLVVVGFASGEIPRIPANYLLVKNIGVSGLQWTDYRARWPERVRAAQAHLCRLWAEGRLTPRVTRTLPLARYGEALAELKAARARGKIILTTDKQR